MDKQNRTSSRRISSRLRSIFLASALAIYFSTTFLPQASYAQTAFPGNGFRIGERLTYNVSMGRFANAGYAEFYTVSAGRLGEKDAIELRAKFKTVELASVAFYMIDETRTTFASPLTGLPLQSTLKHFAYGLPKETLQSYLAVPASHFDLVTMMYRMRHSNGSGSLTMQEGDKVYSVSFQPGALERQKTDAGEFDTTVVSIQSEFFTENGLTEVRINLSNDEARLPVLLRMRTAKGQIRAALSSVQVVAPEPTVPLPIAVPSNTPAPERTPKPAATPTPYIDDQPLPAELAFELGEKLEYRILSAGQPVAKMTLSAKERRLFNGIDSLLLEARFTDSVGTSPFANGDLVRAYVDPETLAPLQMEMKFAGPLRPFAATAKFDQEGSVIVYNGANRVDAPVGTHSILSLLYAARSFNLKPSRDANNPINDTRVAVFWESQPYIFTLRPSSPDILTIDGKAFPSQLVTVATKNALLDQLNIKVWLGNNALRIPIRFEIGSYRVDLISTSNSLPK